MTVKTTRFDMADYLDSKEAIQEYFRQVIENGDLDEIIRALVPCGPNLFFVAYTERLNGRRIITFRRANDREKKRYAENH